MKQRAPRNRTLACGPEEIARLSAQILYARNLAVDADVRGKIICGDTFGVAGKLPKGFVDLLILDPPYNLSKNYQPHSVFAPPSQPLDLPLLWISCCVHYHS